MVAWIFAAGAAAAGVLSHVLYFNKGEHHMYGITYLLTFITAFAGSVTALVQLYGSSITSALASTSAISSSYLTGLTISLLIYRIWLSPLVKFPGPFVARITGLWLTVHAINSDLYLKSEVLHKKYGKYVRTGPSNLSVADADVYEPAYDFRKPWAKADWYVQPPMLQHCYWTTCLLFDHCTGTMPPNPSTACTRRATKHPTTAAARCGPAHSATKLSASMK